MSDAMKRASFALMDALESDALTTATLSQTVDCVAAAGAVKDLIISFGWLDEFNAGVRQ